MMIIIRKVAISIHHQVLTVILHRVLTVILHQVLTVILHQVLIVILRQIHMYQLMFQTIKLFHQQIPIVANQNQPDFTV